MKQKTAIISGGAGKIGFAICHCLYESGINLAIFGSTQAIAEDTKHKLGATDDRCLAIGGRSPQTGSIQAQIMKAVDKFGGIDILISMQGWPPKNQDIMEITEEYWDGILMSHLSVTFKMLQQAVPYLEKSPAARAIFLASPGVFRGDVEDGLAYSTAKGGIVSLTYSAAKMLAKRGITVNCIATGDMYNTYGIANKESEPKARKETEQSGTLSEICKAVSFLTSEEGREITGQVLVFSNN